MQTISEYDAVVENMSEDEKIAFSIWYNQYIKIKDDIINSSVRDTFFTEYYGKFNDINAFVKNHVSRMYQLPEIIYNCIDFKKYSQELINQKKIWVRGISPCFVFIYPDTKWREY